MIALQVAFADVYHEATKGTKNHERRDGILVFVFLRDFVFSWLERVVLTGAQRRGM
jgi:hypothetical protein